MHDLKTLLFSLEPTDLPKRLAGKKVIVCDYPDGRLADIKGEVRYGDP
ncbi:hypothetical protein [Mesorhizobium shangrilense]|uniref:Uncharacterized protein n=1 Tax=Mesorhizobium shangrilense TaxID=460060 RepID=A0ABV2DQA8_9HYPH